VVCVRPFQSPKHAKQQLEQKTKKRAKTSTVDEPEQDHNGQIQFLGINQSAEGINRAKKRHRVKGVVVRVHVMKKCPNPKTKARDNSSQNWKPLFQSGQRNLPEQKNQKRNQKPEEDCYRQIYFERPKECTKEMNNRNRRCDVKRAIVRAFISKYPPDPKTNADRNSNQEWNPHLHSGKGNLHAISPSEAAPPGTVPAPQPG
jgi:hypothetical protein